MIEVNKIYSGHALEVLKTFDDESINMCITSPPYWGLRDYKTNPVKWSDGWEGELGTEPDFNQYIKLHLMLDGVITPQLIFKRYLKKI